MLGLSGLFKIFWLFTVTEVGRDGKSKKKKFFCPNITEQCHLREIKQYNYDGFCCFVFCLVTTTGQVWIVRRCWKAVGGGSLAAEAWTASTWRTPRMWLPDKASSGSVGRVGTTHSRGRTWWSDQRASQLHQNDDQQHCWKQRSYNVTNAAAAAVYKSFPCHALCKSYSGAEYSWKTLLIFKSIPSLLEETQYKPLW